MKMSAAILICISIWTILHPGEAANRPNIILIIADDLGFTDVSFHGSNQIPTPNLDAMAYDGVIMNNYYVQPICTPTRSALLTSRYPIHTGLQSGVILANEPYGLALNETLLPQYLKELGYKNHMVGKWHLGFFAKEYTPLYRGFDTHFGYWGGAEDYWDHTGYAPNNVCGLDFRDQMKPGRNYFGKYSAEAYTERAQELIRDHNKSKPLFLYLPFQSVHSATHLHPLEAPYKYFQKMAHIKDTKRRKFAAMLSALDDAFGNVTATLHEQGMLNNSVIIFSTDNGGPAGGMNMNYASNYPLRGTKMLLWEGGLRGASFVWSPLLKKSSYVSNHMVHVTDWMPSILKVAGYDMSKLPAKHLDGMNVWDSLSNNASSPRDEILLNIDPVANTYAIRVGKMKMIFGKMEGGRYGGWIKPSEIVEPEIELPNGMKVNLLDQQPPTPMDNVDDPTPEYLMRSPQMENILQELGRGRVAPHPVPVHCGGKPANASSNCQVGKAPCLYDISKDPCEYNNLAFEKPDVVKQLLAKVDEYRKTMVKPRNKPGDPKANPVLHNGLWDPWITLDI